MLRGEHISRYTGVGGIHREDACAREKLRCELLEGCHTGQQQLQVAAIVAQSKTGFHFVQRWAQQKKKQNKFAEAKINYRERVSVAIFGHLMIIDTRTLTLLQANIHPIFLWCPLTGITLVSGQVHYRYIFFNSRNTKRASKRVIVKPVFLQGIFEPLKANCTSRVSSMFVSFRFASHFIFVPTPLTNECGLRLFQPHRPERYH